MFSKFSGTFQMMTLRPIRQGRVGFSNQEEERKGGKGNER